MKEPVQLGASPYVDFLRNYRQINARIYLAHVRHRTVGGPPSHADTHPFIREFGGRHYCFAHNGTIPEAQDRLPVDRFQPLGGTDSERLFCHLLDELSDSGIKSLNDEESWTWLQSKLSAAT